MKRVGVGVGLVLVMGMIAVYFATRGTQSPSAVATQNVQPHDDPRVVELSRQVEELQRNLRAMQVERQAPPSARAPDRAKPPEDAQLPGLDVEAQRAADAEQRRQYMAEVARAFNDEKTDPAWSARTAARIDESIRADKSLTNRLRDVECRSGMCRVQIDEDELHTASQRIPRIALDLANVLPNISADYIDQGSGRTMILYLSSQASVTTTTSK